MGSRNEQNRIWITRRQVCDMVKKILDKVGRPNPFVNNRPGKDWWYSFVSRKKLTFRSPSALASYRASACTPERLQCWRSPQESGISLKAISHCAQSMEKFFLELEQKQGMLLVLHRNSRLQPSSLQVLVAFNTIPPMHVFLGVGFSYNPLEGTLPKAYSSSKKTLLFLPPYVWFERSIDAFKCTRICRSN